MKIDGDLRPFAYLPAGVVLGELNCGEVGYLLAGISDHLAIVELTRSGRRVVWYGRAEALSEVDLPRAQDLSEATPSATPSTPPASDPAAGQDDLSAQAEQKIGELQQQLAALAADHSATKVQLQVEQTERAQADARLGEVTNLEHLMAVMMAIMASSLSLDEDDAAADEVEGAAAALPLAITEAPIAADHRQDVEDLRRRNAALSDEIEALRAAAAERAATLEEENARLAGERAAVRAAAEPTAPPGVEAPDDHEEHPACAPLADARAHPEDEAEDRAALAEELRAARQELAEERDARLAAAQGAQRAEQLLAERTAALAEIEAARDSLTAELARARDEAAVTLAEARDQLADERLAHATTVEHADELRRRLAVAEAELTATREALAGAEASAHPITDQSSDDEPHLAEDTRPASGVTPAEAEQLLAALAELDPERLPDYQRLVASPDMPLISRITKAMFQVLVGEAQEDMTALRQRLEKAERAVARAERNAPRHPFKGRKKKTRR